MKSLFPIKQDHLQGRIRPLFVPLVFVGLDECAFTFEQGGERFGYVEQGGTGGGGVCCADELGGENETQTMSKWGFSLPITTSGAKVCTYLVGGVRIVMLRIEMSRQDQLGRCVRIKRRDQVGKRDLPYRCL
jgi:hypothetical protein